MISLLCDNPMKQYLHVIDNNDSTNSNIKKHMVNIYYVPGILS